VELIVLLGALAYPTTMPAIGILKSWKVEVTTNWQLRWQDVILPQTVSRDGFVDRARVFQLEFYKRPRCRIFCVLAVGSK